MQQCITPCTMALCMAIATECRQPPRKTHPGLHILLIVGGLSVPSECCILQGRQAQGVGYVHARQPVHRHKVGVAVAAEGARQRQAEQAGAAACGAGRAARASARSKDMTADNSTEHSRQQFDTLLHRLPMADDWRRSRSVCAALRLQETHCAAHGDTGTTDTDLTSRCC